MTRTSTGRIIGFLFVVLYLELTASAQEITGSISGVAVDSSGAVVPNVKVTVANTKTNIARSVTTGLSGAYRVPFLFFGTYRVVGELSGFKTTQVDNISLSSSEEARVDLTMVVGQVNEVVNVSETSLGLKTEEASVATTIAADQINQLPLLGRQIIGVTLLAPGAYSVNNNSKAQRDSGFVRRNGLSLSVNGLTAGGQGPDQLQLSRIRRSRRRVGEHRHQGGHQRVPWPSLRVPPERQAQRVSDGRQEPAWPTDRQQSIRHFQ